MHLLAAASAPCLPQAMALLPAAWAAARLMILHGPVIFFALAAARALYPKEERLPAYVSSMVIYFLALTLPVWLGPKLSFRWLAAWAGAYGVAGVAVRLWEARQAPARVTNPCHPGAAADPIALGGVITLALLLAALLVTGIFDPRFDHDPLTYQLYFAATWLRDGHVSIVPTPFGDPSQAYGPALASMYYLWLMAPLGNDMLAQTGQWPFLLLTVLAACGLARELGASERREWIAGLFIFMAPFAVYEGRSALSDLAVAGFFTASLYFLVRAGRERKPADLALGLTAAGLMAGCKFTAAPLLVLILPLLAFAGFRARGRGAWAAWLAGIAGAMAGGGIWYARNWWIAGNPFFPISITMLGHDFFPGLYGRAQMLEWTFHLQGVLEWLNIIRVNVSPLLLVLYVPALIYLIKTGAGRMRPKADQADGNPGRDRPLAAAIIYIALLPLLIDRTYWDMMPYQVDRFWIPAVPVLAAVLAVICSRFRGLALAALAVAALFLMFLALALIAMPMPLDEATPIRIVMALPLLAALGFGLAWLHRRLSAAAPQKSPGKTPSRPYLLTPALTAAALFIVTVTGLCWYDSSRAFALSYLNYGKGWAALPCPAAGVTVAYTGSNMPYPLLGPRLQNRVVYVSPSGRVMPLDHELFREAGFKAPGFETPEPMLSGLSLDPKQWADGVVSSGADYLFVMKLGIHALLNTAHDPDGWPLEDSWARAASRTFVPVYSGHSTRIYKVERSVPPDLPDQSYQRPADAVAACAHGANPEGQKYFPLATMAMRAMMAKP